MPEKMRWHKLTFCKICAFTLIAIPLWVLLSPFIIIYKLVETILQPYLLIKQRKEWNERYQNCLKQGIHIDYPPTRGFLIRELPLKWLLDDDIEDDDNDEDDTIIKCPYCNGTGESYIGLVTPLMERDLLNPSIYLCEVCGGEKRISKSEAEKRIKALQKIRGF